MMKRFATLLMVMVMLAVAATAHAGALGHNGDDTYRAQMVRPGRGGGISIQGALGHNGDDTYRAP